jgi:peptide/nickel transport system substrate-binding protein
VTALCITALLAAACGSAVSPSSLAEGSSNPAGGATAYWAEAPSSPPNFIFPFAPPQYFTTANIEQFQQLMYRPLYWLGAGATPTLDEALSLAQPPTYGPGNTVTIVLKPYKWSNGESLDARDVMFWMNMLHAAKVNWAGYVPGEFPDNVADVVVDSASQLTFTLTKSYSATWFTYNELSQITPMPVAWDVTASGAAPGSGGCSSASYGSADLACDGVYEYLARQAGFDPANPETTNKAVSTYASNKLWQVVDGPWRLTSLTSSGTVTMQRNPSYSGPQKATFSTFEELPFASAAAEQSAVAGGRLDVGYLPLSDVSKTTSNPYKPAKKTRIPAAFSLAPVYPWAIDYIAYNFHAADGFGVTGAILSQLYFRQAVQMLVDQSGEIKKILKGYGVPTTGPVPLRPGSAIAAGIGRGNPYPYDPSAAIGLLERNGWSVRPSDLSTCARPGTAPGECGAGIPAGAPLQFSLQYAANASWTAALMAAQKASWARAGIDVSLTPASAEAVVDTAVPCVGGSGCTWELADWGTGWTFVPDVYPTGEELFKSGAGTNVGGYADFIDDAYIAASETSASGLGAYFAYLAKQLPVIFEPVPAASLTEIKDNLRGVTPQNALGSLTPENWYRSR